MGSTQTAFRQVLGIKKTHKMSSAYFKILSGKNPKSEETGSKSTRVEDPVCAQGYRWDPKMIETQEQENWDTNQQ